MMFIIFKKTMTIKVNYNVPIFLVNDKDLYTLLFSCNVYITCLSIFNVIYVYGTYQNYPK